MMMIMVTVMMLHSMVIGLLIMMQAAVEDNVVKQGDETARHGCGCSVAHEMIAQIVVAELRGQDGRADCRVFGDHHQVELAKT